jgi:hypothetical protein
MAEGKTARGIEGYGSAHRTYIDYIDRTREFYLAAGFGNPYRWAHHEDAPFTPLTRPLSECRIGLITTAAEYDPAKGDQGPHAPYNAGAKFYAIYSRASDSDPDLRISHIGYDRENTVPEDINAYFPLKALRQCAAAGTIGAVGPRFHGLPTLRSQRKTTERDAPEILRLLREDEVDAALLVAV